jgi:hypothetical protein
MSCVATSTDIGFEVLTAVVTRNVIFWDITLCCLFQVNRCFGNICRLQFQCLLAAYFHAALLLGLFFDPETGGNVFSFLVKCRLTFNGLYVLITPKIEIINLN